MAETVHWYEPDAATRKAWDAWVAGRPECVREVAKRFPPWALWKLALGDDPACFQRVYVQSYQEVIEVGEEDRVTLTVAVDGRFNRVSHERAVFGIDPDDLVPCELPGPDEPVGSAGLTPEQVKLIQKRHNN